MRSATRDAGLGRGSCSTRPRGRFPNSRPRALTTRASRTSRVATSASRGRSPSSRASHRSAATSATSTRTSACSRRSTCSTRTFSRGRFSRQSTSSGSRRRTTRASRVTRTGLAPSTSCPRPRIRHPPVHQRHRPGVLRQDRLQRREEVRGAVRVAPVEEHRRRAGDRRLRLITFTEKAVRNWTTEPGHAQHVCDCDAACACPCKHHNREGGGALCHFNIRSRREQQVESRSRER